MEYYSVTKMNPLEHLLNVDASHKVSIAKE